jgi:hypothetical protein
MCACVRVRACRYQCLHYDGITSALLRISTRAAPSPHLTHLASVSPQQLQPSLLHVCKCIHESVCKRTICVETVYTCHMISCVRAYVCVCACARSTPYNYAQCRTWACARKCQCVCARAFGTCVRVRVCTCACLRVRARACACVLVRARARTTVLSSWRCLYSTPGSPASRSRMGSTRKYDRYRC